MSLTAVIYDKNDTSAAGRFWRPGSLYYQATGRADLVYPAQTLSEALGWLHRQPLRSIAQVEIWAHGAPGGLTLGGKWLKAEDLGRWPLADVGRSMTRDGVFWLRSCSSFAGQQGHTFAYKLSDALGQRVAGHTHLIGPLHSGLHSLRPGQKATWSKLEGMSKDGRIGKAASKLWAPNTITCLRNEIPDGW